MQKSNSQLYKLRLKQNLRVVGLGDSSVFGIGDIGENVRGNSGFGWTARLAHDLKAKKYLNLSKNGARARDVWTSQLAGALAAKPDLVLICVGGNDALRNNFQPSDVANYLNLTVRKLEEAGSVVVLLGLHDPSKIAPAPKLIKNVLLSRVKQVNRALSWVTEQNNNIFISTIERNEIYDKSFWHIDRMHPSPRGHQYLADLVRRNLSLPRRKKSKIPFAISIDRRAKTLWLITNGLKWFLRRSIDLLPALIYLVTLELIRSWNLGNYYQRHLGIYLDTILKLNIETDKNYYLNNIFRDSEVNREVLDLNHNLVYADNNSVLIQT
ncbi:MAG: hypothetical protein RL677_438 [Actinomycetota bacterium]|jgi:lysophospholipase L1-like esterase